MAVTSVQLHSAGASGSASGTDKGGVKASFVTRYRVKTDDPLDTAPYILGHFRITPTLPWMGRRYSFGNTIENGAICREVSVEYIQGSQGVHEVSCKFEPPDGGEDDKPETGKTEKGETTDNPLDWRDEIDVSFTQFSEPLEFAVFIGAENARHGLSPFLRPGQWQAVTNSLGKPFDPLPEQERNIKIIRITRHVPKYDNFLFGNFQGTINNDNFTINKPTYRFSEDIGKYQALIRLSNAFGITNGIKFWRQSVELWVHPRDWRNQLLDRGDAELLMPGDVDDDGTELSADNFPANRPWDLKTLKDEDGYPQMAPCLLNGRGKRLSLNPPEKPVWLEYTGWVERPFAGLVGAAW